MRSQNRTEKNPCRGIVVSGATGFIGQHLIPLLLDRNFEVIAIARDISKAEQFHWFKDVQFISHDLHKETPPFKDIGNFGLIHLAWDGLQNRNSTFHLEKNLPSNIDFLKSMVLKGVKQVLVTGTCLEYGLQSGPISSAAPASPDNPYAVAKDCLRRYLERLAEDIPYRLQWARLFHMHGKGQDSQSLLSRLDAAIDSGAPCFNMDGGEQLRDYLPIGEVVQQIHELWESRRTGVFNVCSGRPISVRRLVEEHIAQRGGSTRPVLGFHPYPRGEPMAFWGIRDIGKTIYLPALPNSPLQTNTADQNLAPMRLRYNADLKLLENEAFDGALIDYSANYENSQACSPRFRRHMTDVLAILKEESAAGGSIVEVGCGKGDFVELVRNDGYFKIRGFDASYEGNDTSIERRYLSWDDRISADLVVLRHVLEHIPQPYNFLSMLRDVFGAAKIYIEVPNADWIFGNEAYFDITYEHANYFSPGSLRALFASDSFKHGLLFDNQYQYAVASLGDLNRAFDDRYRGRSWQYVNFEELFPTMSAKITEIRNVLGGNKLFVWGAATKGCMFLAHCSARKDIINKVSFAVDINPNKIGKYLPGSLVPIRSKSDFFAAAKSGDVVVISNPAYREEILSEINAAGVLGVVAVTL